MKDSVEILSSMESGVSDSWEWVVKLSRNEDKSFRLNVDQEMWEGELEAELVSYELPSFARGSELFEFLQNSWINDHDEALGEHAWDDIVLRIRDFDVSLSDEVHCAAQLAFHPVESAKPRKLTSIEECVRRAQWESRVYRGGGGMWATIADQQSVRSAVATYVAAYLEQYGKLPEGEHRVLERVVRFPAQTEP